MHAIDAEETPLRLATVRTGREPSQRDGDQKCCNELARREVDASDQDRGQEHDDQRRGAVGQSG